jgi:hypothetical protein
MYYEQNNTGTSLLKFNKCQIWLDEQFTTNRNTGTLYIVKSLPIGDRIYLSANRNLF